jgi:hypothetical protein
MVRFRFLLLHSGEEKFLASLVVWSLNFGFGVSIR